MVKTFLKILGWRFLFLARSEHLLVSSVTLSCKTQYILTLSMLVYYKLNSFFLRNIRTYALPGCLVCSPRFSAFLSYNFFILKFYCFMLLLNFITSKYRFFRRYLGMVSVFPDTSSYWQQLPHTHFLYCSSSACSDCTEGSD